MFIDDIKEKLKVAGEVGFAMCMISRSKLVVSGVKRIIICRTELIKLKLDSEILFIEGSKLCVEQIGGGDVYIHGYVNGVKFDG